MIQQDAPTSLRQPPRGPARHRSTAAFAVALGMGAVLAGCGEDIFQPQWVSGLDTVELFTLARPELNLPSAFGFTLRRRYLIEAPGATGNWDVALDTQEGEMVLAPPTALGISSQARIAPRPGVPFEEVEEAPADTTEYSAQPVDAEVGRVYVVRTGETASSRGRRCVFFAKMEILELEPEVGTMTFLYEANPLCNDRRLIPTAETEGG